MSFLLVRQRGCQAQDQCTKADKANGGEEVSSIVADTGSNQVGVLGNIADNKIGNSIQIHLGRDRASRECRR